MIIPKSTQSAHQIASASMSLVAIKAEEKLKKYQFDQKYHNNSIKKRNININNDDDNNSELSQNNSDDENNIHISKSPSDSEIFELQKLERHIIKSKSVILINNKNNCFLQSSTDELFMRLSEDISCQRRLLKPSITDII
jgi:hypothetical protein